MEIEVLAKKDSESRVVFVYHCRSTCEHYGSCSQEFVLQI